MSYPSGFVVECDVSFDYTVDREIESRKRLIDIEGLRLEIGDISLGESDLPPALVEYLRRRAEEMAESDLRMAAEAVREALWDYEESL